MSSPYEEPEAMKARRNRFGKVRPMIHADFQGQKFVAVGSNFYHSSKWPVPLDFLHDFPKYVFTREWFEAELAKPFEERHPVIQWYDLTCKLQAKQEPDSEGMYRITPSGPMDAYILLSYDLYILQHHSSLPDRLVERLKNRDGFQGARHEVFAVATCIRAGFDIEFEDDTDRTTKHTEFVATHRETGQKINVEAKSKRRKGVLSKPGPRVSDERVRVRVRRLINDAIAKPVQHPYVIFLDLNLPPSSPIRMSQAWFDKIVQPIIRDREEKGESDPWSLLVFSNYPDHYLDGDEPAPSGYAVGLFGKNPPIDAAHPEAIRAVIEAAWKFGNIPESFEDMG